MEDVQTTVIDTSRVMDSDIEQRIHEINRALRRGYKIVDIQYSARVLTIVTAKVNGF